MNAFRELNRVLVFVWWHFFQNTGSCVSASLCVHQCSVVLLGDDETGNRFFVFWSFWTSCRVFSPDDLCRTSAIWLIYVFYFFFKYLVLLMSAMFFCVCVVISAVKLCAKWSGRSRGVAPTSRHNFHLLGGAKTVIPHFDLTQWHCCYYYKIVSRLTIWTCYFVINTHFNCS